MSRKNIVNHKEISNFLKILQDSIISNRPFLYTEDHRIRYDNMLYFLNHQLKNYIYKKSPTKRFWFYRMSANKDLNILTKGGPFHFVDLNRQLNISLKELSLFIYNNIETKKIRTINIDAALSQMKNKKIKEEQIIIKQEGQVNEEIVFEDGLRIVKLIDKKAINREGLLMHSCLARGYYDESIIFNLYSLRDKNNVPLVTFDVTFSPIGLVVGEIKEKYNTTISNQYKPYINTFAEKNQLSFSESYNLSFNSHYYIQFITELTATLIIFILAKSFSLMYAQLILSIAILFFLYKLKMYLTINNTQAKEIKNNKSLQNK